MSAYFVSDAVIDDAVTVYIRDAKAPVDPTSLGRRMLAMNLLALESRYDLPADEREDYMRAASNYTFTEITSSQVQQCKSLSCLLYQCSEGDVPSLPLYRELTALEGREELRLSKGRVEEKYGEMRPLIPGWDAAQWGRE